MRLFGHPLHPPLTHFPIVLWTASFACDAFGAWKADPAWWTVGFWSAVAGLVVGIPTAVTGFLDYGALPERHPAERAATIHMATMLVTVGLFLAEVLLRAKPCVPTPTTLILSGLGCATMGVGGWLGAHLVYRYGVGVDRES